MSYRELKGNPSSLDFLNDLIELYDVIYAINSVLHNTVVSFLSWNWIVGVFVLISFNAQSNEVDQLNQSIKMKTW